MLRDMKGRFRARTIDEVCDKEDFHIEVLGNTYCKLATNKMIECPYQSKVPDQNGLYPCLHLKYQRFFENEVQ